MVRGERLTLLEELIAFVGNVEKRLGFRGRVVWMCKGDGGGGFEGAELFARGSGGGAALFAVSRGVGGHCECF